jgi:hypothetical protein
MEDAFLDLAGCGCYRFAHIFVRLFPAEAKGMGYLIVKE